ncbi:addiction module protein [Gloeobacter kilaueensis]|uniref:Addiction module component n=1 Tax=Gloeobacter kilaueensis (strain ATCC BAA-2537 / CCAP 1431/1 / ULC 316 / JS1) TaxID=1183438 RepID=U5QFP9_GLOK1|nr:addiction module protein [Gloeobacter kilaueensis]AGY57792.1 hypothetical protein GKIL_1546 [Gloeobacter kilaueensis JS1]
MSILSHDEITRLTPQERLALIEQLWDSLDETALPLPASQQTELASRLDTLEQDRTRAVNWEQLQALMAQRCP